MVLIGVIALILLGYGWWFLAPRKAAVPDAEIEVTQVYYAPPPRGKAAELARLPLFDPSTGEWIVAGKPRHSVAELVEPALPEGRDMHGTGRSLTVRLPDGSGKGVMQAAMRALAREGICTAAFYVDGIGMAPIIRIRSVADGKGGAAPCRDRFNPPR